MRWIAAFGLCIGLLSMTAGDRGLPALLRARQQAQTIAREIDTLKSENAALRRRVAALRMENALLRARAQSLRHDARTIEIEARETLGLARSGEVVVLRRP